MMHGQKNIKSKPCPGYRPKIHSKKKEVEEKKK